jgi:hypothetical protein
MPALAGAALAALLLSASILPARAAGDSRTVPAPDGVQATCPCTLFDPGVTPSPPYEADLEPVEIGVRFFSDSSGYVSAVRFYKHTQNDGVHTGSLWSAGGDRLATGTFTGETSSGWQQLDFASPVPVTAGAVYVASYHTTTGYAQDPLAFSGSGIDRAPLHAPADGVGGGNGVYAYGASQFPQNSYQGSNYWVDVVFVTEAGPDANPPAVVSTGPSAGETGIPVSAHVTARFSEPMDAASIDGASFELRLGATPVAATVSYDAGTHTARLIPSGPLAPLTTYTAKVHGALPDPAVRDLAGNPMASDLSWSFTTAAAGGPAPAGWYAGDMHVHRSCGGAPVPLSTIHDAMIEQNLDVVSVLADMGNGEVLDPETDLPRVDGGDDPVSTPGRIVHWDAEWHWDANFFSYPHQALGGHIVALGLSEAYQIWEEYTYPVFDWAHQRGGIAGFVHMQYLDDAGGLPQTLNCCTPVEYPVEVALGAADFIAEDVAGSESAIQAYYRLLNCGFRPGFAAGSDYPCQAAIGGLLTYAQTPDGTLTYRGWLAGIAAGRTVVSRNGRREFVALRVNGTATPGDQVDLAGAGDVQVSAVWSSLQNRNRTIQIVKNGQVVATRSASAGPAGPDSLTATVHFTASGWLCARVMGANGHVVHTAAVFVRVNGAPVRASTADAQYYVDWMDELIDRTSPGGDWSQYFATSRDEVHARYFAARSIYQAIADGVVAVEPVQPGDGGLSLAVRPNPSHGPLRLALALPLAGNATLEVMDVQGRRVAAHDTGPLGPGRHELTLNERLAPGVYLVRLAHGGQSRTRRAVLLD